MKRGALAVSLAAGILALAGCSSGPFHSTNPYYTSGMTPAYYDGGLGPIQEGYWASDGSFYFRTSADQPWQQATGDHVRKTPAKGFKAIHVVAAPATNPSQ